MQSRYKERATKQMQVYGSGVSELTQCAHYHSKRDVVAIRFKCCDAFYACIHCHEELADHAPERWTKDEWHTQAILCGRCRNTLSIAEYMGSENVCPRCRAEFNPRCADHYHYYFQF